MPSDVMFKTMNGVHRLVLRLSGGRLGSRISTMPVLELTTTGRKSGLARTVMLTAPLTVGEALVVVASRAGDDKTPAWFHNLTSNPEVTVKVVGEQARPMRARVASDAERAELWPRITSQFSSYADYQRKTSRQIPLVFLEPRG